MKSEILNNSFGSQQNLGVPQITKEQERQIIASLFEQLMLFDKIVISTNRTNTALFLLVKNLGINTVERLIDYNYIQFMLWTPLIVTGMGHKREDGSIDESAIYGKPPIVAGALSENDTDPEKNVNTALSYFNLHRDRKRIFIKKATKNYIIPDGLEFSSDSAKFVIDSYQNNALSGLGLPFEKEPNQLDLNQRFELIELGNKVLETAFLAKYNLKSFNNYEHYKIFENNLANIGKAYKTSEHVSEILKIENIPNLQNLFLDNNLNFDNIFKLRYLSSAKYFRKWINNIDESLSAQEITSEYLKEIKGQDRFINTTEGKFIRNIAIFGASLALGTLIATPAVGLGLGLFDTYLLDKLLKGNNPSIFIEDLKREIKND